MIFYENNRKNRERLEDLQERNPELLSEWQKDFIRYMRIKEEIEAGLDGE